MSGSDSNPNVHDVLLLTATVGSGHNSAAAAIAAQLGRTAPGVKVECLDVLKFTPRLFRAYYAEGFALAMTRFNRIYGLGYRLTDLPSGPSRGLEERRRLWTEALAMKRLGRYLVEHPADLIVHTHFLAPPMIGRMMRSGRIGTRQFVAITDLEVHRFWYSENVDHWFAPAEYSTRRLRSWGIEEEHITVSGIPIHPKWSEPVDREKVLAEWRLPSDRKIVLLSGGTEFTCGPIAKIARRIAAASDEAYVVVLAGRNKKLLGEIASLGQTPERIVGVGFTDRLHELGSVCSMMVTKSGGITTAECLAKGTPMVLLRPVPGHEAGNAKYLEGKGAAVVTRTTREVVHAVTRLLNEPKELERLSQAARRLHRPGAETIAEAIAQAVSSDR